MSKVKKLFRDPALFFRDAKNNRRPPADQGTPTYVVGFSTWKQYLRKFFPDRNLTFLPREISKHEFDVVWQKKISADPDSEIFIWGFKTPPFLLEFIKKNNVKVVFVEDGFVRSVQLGATKTPPMSLCLDTRTPYFNAREPSDLEVLLNEHNFAAEPGLLERADKAIALLLKSGVSKYNNAAPVDINALYGPKTAKRILVVGQVEDDASIAYGCNRPFTNNDLVRMAVEENPGCQVIYKPHPDVLEGHRPMQSNPADVADICLIIKDKVPLAQALESIDHVYTITSLAGFEALLRGIKVTTIGAPFYSGWGLTDDRQPTPRRTRTLSVNELFAGAYLLYPKYFDTTTGEKRELEDVIAAIQGTQKVAVPVPVPPTVQPVLAIEKTPAPPAPRKVTDTVPATYLVGDLEYLQTLSSWFNKRNFVQIPAKTTVKDFDTRFKKSVEQDQDAEFLIVGGFGAPALKNAITSTGRKISYLDEGFIGSVEPPARGAPPFSVLIDAKAPHYEAGRASELEDLLNSYDFDAHPEVAERSELFYQQFLESGLSKYNHLKPVPDLEAIYGKKNKKRILVIGQDESKASFLASNPRRYTNNELVLIAATENPDAQILFREHVGVTVMRSAVQSDAAEVRHLCQIVERDIPLAQALETVDHVYTISSLGGFEAALRGITTTVLGVPFYAGWGACDDRHLIERRRRKLSIEQIFSIAYVIYPKYLDPLYKHRIDLGTAISRLIGLQANPRLNIAVAKKVVTEQVELQLKPVQKTAAVSLPEWFQAHPGPQLREKVESGKALYLHFPWIAEHGDTLINRINDGGSYELAALDMVKDIDDNSVRKSVGRFVRDFPDLYRKMVIRRLVPLRRKIKGFILTFDWAPVMRIIATVCKDLDIPVILIPHESVFVDRQKYYWDVTAQASVPVGDVILGWGALQREIFLERGYPADRFIAVGAPKFDTYHDYTPQLEHAQFCALFSLDPHRKIVLFAAQPLDSQLDPLVARESQRQAVSDLLACCVEADCQLLVRLPPSKDDVIGPQLRAELVASGMGAIDDATCYLVAPEEAIFHCAVVTAVNSTMLFEGVLQGRAAISMKYVEFDQIWEHVGIPAVTSREQLKPLLESMLRGEWTPPAEGMQWAANMFGVGEFDGQAARRIAQHLDGWASGNQKLEGMPGPLERLFSKQYLDVVAIPSSAATAGNGQKYLSKLLNARHIISTRDSDTTLGAVSSVEVFFQWGITENLMKQRQREMANALGKPVVFIEDGFIRSVDIGLSGEPGLGIILDDTTAYYDATKASRLERLLQSGPELTEQQKARAHAAIRKVVQARVSKYNHAPDVPLKIGVPGRKKVLLVDQRYGDQSVESGLASEASFEKMLYDAIRERSECDIIVKQHPDAIKGGKSSYFSQERLAKYSHLAHNLYTVDFDINPYALFDIVDEVFVGTSGMGYEALMAGKKVRCYGMPFYAGWGVTDDRIELPRRSRKRTVEDLFHFAYIESSRYFDPERNCPVEVEDLVEYIARMRDRALFSTKAITTQEDEAVEEAPVEPVPILADATKGN